MTRSCPPAPPSSGACWIGAGRARGGGDHVAARRHRSSAARSPATSRPASGRRGTRVSSGVAQMAARARGTRGAHARPRAGGDGGAGLRMRTKHARRRAVRIWCTASARACLIALSAGIRSRRGAGGGPDRPGDRRAGRRRRCWCIWTRPKGPVRTAWAANGEGICRPRRGELYTTRAQGAVDAPVAYSARAGAPLSANIPQSVELQC